MQLQAQIQNSGHDSYYEIEIVFKLALKYDSFGLLKMLRCTEQRNFLGALLYPKDAIMDAMRIMYVVHMNYTCHQRNLKYICTHMDTYIVHCTLDTYE